ncbi:glycosyltransferase, partial [Chloroflexota bacterium]
MGDPSKQDRGNVENNQIVYLTTFPPRRCGIATFTYDLTQAMDSLFRPAIKSNIVAMNTSEVSGYRYSNKVIFQINQKNTDEYITVAEKLNRIDTIKAVSIQHEFGIFGGEWGLDLIPFLKTLTKPKVITFHSVITDPSKRLQEAVRLLADNCDAIVVMAQLSREILIKEYGISAEKIRIIPHGIHDKPYVLSGSVKKERSLRNKTVLTTFGMLHKNKGLEYVIEGLPRVLDKHQDFVYMIVGATHPNILETEGETYRNSLTERVYELGVSNHVKFYNKYFSTSELLNFLSMTDIYLSTSIDPGQAVSGTLSYAMGIG